jgi:acyl carrier protein
MTSLTARVRVSLRPARLHRHGEKGMMAGKTRAEGGEVRRHVRQVIAEILSIQPTEVDETELLSSYGVTSVELIDVAVKLEAKYDIQLDPAAMKDLTCFSLSENVLASLATR